MQIEAASENLAKLFSCSQARVGTPWSLSTHDYAFLSFPHEKVSLFAVKPLFNQAKESAAVFTQSPKMLRPMQVSMQGSDCLNIQPNICLNNFMFQSQILVRHVTDCISKDQKLISTNKTANETIQEKAIPARKRFQNIRFNGEMSSAWTVRSTQANSVCQSDDFAGAFYVWDCVQKRKLQGGISASALAAGKLCAASLLPLDVQPRVLVVTSSSCHVRKWVFASLKC